MSTKIEKKIDELREKIRKYDYEYYVKAEPSISDEEYDMLMKELEKLENDNPKLIFLILLRKELERI